MVWIAAHSPQAKGRVERSFGTAQDRLVKGLRIAGVQTLEQANRYLNEEFLPWWNQHLVVAPANPVDAHRPLGPEHDLAASLSQVVTRQVDNDYTIRLEGKIYRIVSDAMPAGLRGAVVRVEQRLGGQRMVRFRERYWSLAECQKPSKVVAVTQPNRKRSARKKPAPSPKMRSVMQGLLAQPSLPVWKAAQIDRSRTSDLLD